MKSTSAQNTIVNDRILMFHWLLCYADIALWILKSVVLPFKEGDISAARFTIMVFFSPSRNE